MNDGMLMLLQSRRRSVNETPDEGDVALFLISAIAAQLKAKGLIDVDQLEQGSRIMLTRPISPKQRASIEMALNTIQGLKGIPPSR
jgi:hypothetical protein